MKNLLLLACLALLPALAADTQATLEKADRDWAAAVVAKDYAAMERLFAADLIYAHSSGVVENKAEYIERLKNGAQRYDQFAHESTTVHLYGNSAVVHSRMRAKGVSNGKDFNDHLMVMHFWVKQGGSWKLVAHQSLKLAQ